ncbi:MinD/ParA family ATP-binding protein [Millisia brevis]|uniref:MinD/ParA family ATP-binding protein n=1 Tax=Millisia brevis TaxID=264148 RepID=UPI000835E7A2|nr:MinD/ParA family protein [Millisia brevis]
MTDTQQGPQDTTDRSAGEWTPSHSITVPTTAQPTLIRTKEDVERAVATAPTVPNEAVPSGPPAPSGWAQVPVTPLQAPPAPRPNGHGPSPTGTGRPLADQHGASIALPGSDRRPVPSEGDRRPVPADADSHPARAGAEHPAAPTEVERHSGAPDVDGARPPMFFAADLPAAETEMMTVAPVEQIPSARGDVDDRAPAEPVAPLPPPQRVTRDAAPFAAPAPESAVDELTLLRPTKRPARHGLRKLVYTASAGSINLGPSQAELEHDQLVTRINQPMRGRHKIAFVSIKGGVGKTTVANTVGSTFASVRGDRVIAIDANPDLGTLADRVHREHEYTVRDLLADPKVRTYSDVRRYTSQGDSRLEVLASEVDPTTAEAFSESDYLDTLRILEVHYNIVLTDCGTGISHSAMHGILNQADALVIISSTARDGARSAVATVTWLNEHGYKDLVSHSMVAINSLRPGPGALDPERLEQVFLSRGVRGVANLPYDAHLAEGGPIEMSLLGRRTTNAYLQLAASLADGFARITPDGS